MKRTVFFLLLLPLFAAASATRLSAQDAPAPLESFIVHVARLWATGDAGALADLAPADRRIMLDIGEVNGSVQGRHAAAALRAMFSERETAAIRPTRATIAGGRPLRGFGEMTWTSRSRGMSDLRTVTLYIGTEWEGNGWRIRELRILR
ncbi:MAG: hypothetical protein H0X65_16645 [Gemmatimonadetes bacterium]|nr:hypothetical protein [Gemmatimonadota bacterium]